ncbi:pyocin S6 family toxin immunity protein [Pseudomonas sp. NPDC089741]|uniref:pyocin S6 family toxin immunity protein n=1 Tax=Pseudomonas sp. NPDC089741 TaxID=3364470 RepID=UPI0037F7774B
MFLWISGFLKGDDEDDALKYELTVGLEFESAVLAAMGWKNLGKSPEGEYLLTPDQVLKIGLAINQQLPSELDLFIGIRG